MLEYVELDFYYGIGIGILFFKCLLRVDCKLK